MSRPTTFKAGEKVITEACDRVDSINAALEALKRTCLRCGHAWTLRSAVEPLRCPKCGSPYWDRPKQSKES